MNEIDFKENPQNLEFKLIIYLKDDRILAYNQKHGLFSLKLNVENLERMPDKSRFVNLGQSALLTGGMIH